ncbi:malonyl-CoA O-methyltransferase [Pasteurella langaaensis DSM 22999]|uniref:Malonyl-[acyl-carrier protein] O-methyltransferase n=1 Tax=Alitibacter langaaensis DSM 22999 TaxID=1122935 RepID=A0A2U0TCZ1_9PAST|nr:malonyl-ACP O-methyltransferase BioC [Pasteurella langaaensis]PVX41384.1 malonyl-CoA O-methyltransferase [Pasteurella langaaensis DSM 22999]
MTRLSQVQRCFSAARNSYDQQAIVQYKIAKKLTSLVAQQRTDFEHCLEIGCGTGIFTRELAKSLNIDHWELNDLCDNQHWLQQILPAEHFHFQQGDAEQLRCDQAYDLIATASTVQWFNQKQQFIERCAAQLKPQGLLVFSTFDSDNLYEIKQLTGIGLDYPSLAQWQQWLAPQFEILHLSAEKMILEFEQPREVLQHLKQTGVTATNQQMWTKGKLQQFYQNYMKNYRTLAGNVHLTYTPILALAKRK